MSRPTAFRRRFNLRKANWSGYATDVDILIDEVDPTPENYERFVEAIRVTSRKHIPRGCRSHYIPGLSEESKSLYEAYKKQYMSNHFDSTTLDTGNGLISKMAAENKKRWEEMITSTDLTVNSQKAWQTIRMISNDPTASKPPCLVTANQVAHQLLVNGRGEMPTKPRCPKLSPISEDDSSLVFPFTEEEYKKGIATLKNKKSSGIDDVLVERKNLGPRAHRWLHSMLNVCFTENRIPKVWRQSKIIAILKPGKDSAIPKSYRPISLLCHIYVNLYVTFMVPTTPACAWWNRPEDDNSSGKLESTHPSRTSVKSDQGFLVSSKSCVSTLTHYSSELLLPRHQGL